MLSVIPSGRPTLPIPVTWTTPKNQVSPFIDKVCECYLEDDHLASFRREREEVERQRAAAAYQKAHAEGKTDQARADLARLAIIRQQREDAAKRREADKKAKEESTTKKR